jgi:hypothetical protein
MNIQWEDGEVVFGDLDEFLQELLARLPDAASPDDEPARQRLFGSPSGGRDPEADAEWKEMVEPELHELFRSRVDVVRADLENLQTIEGEQVLRVPADHLQAWVHTLNQARLAIGARHNIEEADMEGQRDFSSPERGFALLQIEIYGLILGFLLRHTDL